MGSNFLGAHVIEVQICVHNLTSLSKKKVF